MFILLTVILLIAILASSQWLLGYLIRKGLLDANERVARFEKQLKDRK